MNSKSATLTVLFSLFITAFNPISAQPIAAGGRHSLAICADSTVEAWGYNGYGQLGNGNTDEQHSGVPVNGVNDIVQVAGGLFHSLLVKKDGTVWSCGRNTLGPLGDGTNDDKLIPVQVAELTDITQAAGGGEHSLFLKSDGTVWACGNNSSGQLGDGSGMHQNIPVQVNDLTDIIQVAAGAEFSLFLKQDGTVWACGHNGYGQFGNGTNSSSNMPVQVSGLSAIVQVSAGEWHSLFVKSDGTVLSSGRNQYGQLGNGTTADTNVATIVSTLAGITQAEAGGIHSVFLKQDGTVWSCGLNSGGNNDGQLGDGTMEDRHIPVQVISVWKSEHIIRAEATREHSLFLTSAGDLYAAGRNNYGQLGYGSFTTSNALTSVASSAVCQTVLTSLHENASHIYEVQLFPNPCSGVFYIKTETPVSTIEIINTAGKSSVFHATYQSANYVEFNISSLPNGLYYVRITGADFHLISKIIMLQKS
jgi:alpha-tubulin suppressor-like RCC1 family protein